MNERAIPMLEASTLWQLIDRRADSTPDNRLAVDERGRSLTFGEYRQRAERAAAGLHALGVGPDIVVSWQLPTRLEALILAGALSRLGAVQNPILPIYREREVGFVTRQLGSRFFIEPGTWRGFDFTAMAKGLGNDGMQILTVDADLPEAEPSALPPPPEAPATADDAPVRWVFYSSGTTAEPKGAKHTDSTIMVTARGMSARLDFGRDARNSLLFPFTHVAGPIWLASSLLTGGSQILTEVFEPASTIDLLSREGVTHAGSGTVFHLAYLKAQRERPDRPLFPQLRNCPGGGAPKPPQLHYDCKRELGGIGVLSGWGLTEAPILTMATHTDPDDRLAETEGRPMPGVQLRVVTLDGRDAEPGEEGELRAQAPQLMKGYVDENLEDAAFDEHGFFRTGDLGRIDDLGYVTVTGRLKDVIIRKGENISAKEVEDLLFSHPDVADVAVIGLPDAEVGERCCAVLVAKDAANPPSFDALVAHLKAEGLMTQKLPERIEFLPSLPRNPAGKVLKHELRQRYS